jgi:hypothetical protein
VCDLKLPALHEHQIVLGRAETTQQELTSMSGGGEMKIKRIVLISVMAGLPGLALADEATNVRFAGSSQGKQVCKAVVQDDVKMLKRALRSYQSSLVFRYAHDNSGRDVARDFTCNNMDLWTFAGSMGAQRVAGYIAGDAGADEAQLAVAGK